MSLSDTSTLFPESVPRDKSEQNGRPLADERLSFALGSREGKTGVSFPKLTLGTTTADSVKSLEPHPSDQHFTEMSSNAECSYISHSELNQCNVQTDGTHLSQGRGPQEFGDALARETPMEHPPNLEDMVLLHMGQQGTVDSVDMHSQQVTTMSMCSSDGHANTDHKDNVRVPTKVVIDDRNVDKPHDIEEECSKSEFKNIMDQFDYGDYSFTNQPGPSLDVPSLQPSFDPPPRKSSLEPIRPFSPSIKISQPDDIPSSLPSIIHDSGSSQESSDVSLRRKSTISLHPHFSTSDEHRLSSPRASTSLHKVLPPAPDPEPDLPFDFHRFLEQLRHRTADPVAKFLRSFLNEFSKKQWMVHEQMKIISDFLTFITNKMALCEVWREVSDAEFDNAKEGMEKLVMNRLYTQTFSPAIPPISMPIIKGKRKPNEKELDYGRRGQHQEDIERDAVLAQKVRIYGWVQEEHLDIAPVGESGRRFLTLAQQGLP